MQRIVENGVYESHVIRLLLVYMYRLKLFEKGEPKLFLVLIKLERSLFVENKILKSYSSANNISEPDNKGQEAIALVRLGFFRIFESKRTSTHINTRYSGNIFPLHSVKE